MTNGIDGIRRDRRGNLPFALVAVTILLAASAYCAVAAAADDREDRSDGMEDEMSAVNAAVYGIRSFIEKGMGENIHCISTDSSLGSLSERTVEFSERMDAWMGDMFPAEDSGVRVTVESYKMSLGVQDLRLPSDYHAADGYVPAFLKATGTVEAVFESESGKSQRTLTLNADGGALPLANEAGTMFESILSDGGSLLSQMVSYQLTSLAQYRVMNGYGALGYYGEYGTSSVITQEDVSEAYSRALRAVESIVFRDAEGGLMTGNTDLARTFVDESGTKLTINVGAVYAQALAAVADRIVGKWFDYFLGNKVLQICDYVDDTLKNAWDSFTSFLTGKNSFSAEPYIKEIVGDVTIEKNAYIAVYIPSAPGSGIKPYGIPVLLPEGDLLASETIQNFKSTYRNDSNRIREWLYTMVNTAISQAAQNRFTGTVTVDMRDTGSFSEVLRDAVVTAMDGASEAFNGSLLDTLNASAYPDPFYSAIYDAICRDKQEIFGTDFEAFKQSCWQPIYDSVYMFYTGAHGTPPAREYAQTMADTALDIPVNKIKFTMYVDKVDELMSRLEALKDVQTSKSSIIEKGCIAIIKGGMLLADGAFDVTGHLEQVCDRFADSVAVNSNAGEITLPDRDDFLLAGTSETVEKLDVSVRSSPSISVGKPSVSDCSHQTGLEDGYGANYCTVYPVRITDTVSYSVTGSGSLAELMGSVDSATAGTMLVDIDLGIPVFSGWALAGIDYESSADVLHDLWKALLKVIEPLLEPLRRAMNMAGKLADALKEVITEASRYAARYVEEMYEKIITPLTDLITFVKEHISDGLGEKIFQIADGMTAIVDMTAKTQTVGFAYGGFTLKATIDCSSLAKSTKHLLKLEMSGNVAGTDIGAFLDIKLRDKSPNTLITGGFSAEGNNWNISGTIDPTMIQTDHLLSVNGNIKGVAIDMVMPELVQYREIDMRLSEVPAVGLILSNIPSPIPGTKIALDAGIDVRYAAPFESGVLINEIEANPEGDDAGNEWAEIINSTSRSVDISGWRIVNSRGGTYTVGNVELAPGARYVAEFDGNFLLNKNETLALVNSSGDVVDETAKFSDRDNDSKTYQRGADASTEWGFFEATRGTKNAGGLFGEKGLVTSMILDILKDAAKKAMGELKHVTDVNGVADLFTIMMTYAIEEGIERLSSCLVEASIFVSVEFQDVTGTGCLGFEMYVKAGKDLAGDILRYLVGRAESMLLGIEDPYGVDLGEAACDDIYLGVTVYTGISTPRFLPNSSTVTGVNIGVDIACNVSAIGTMLKKDLGTWNVRAGALIRNCPTALIPPGLDADAGMSSDLWLLRLDIGPS